MKGNILLGLSPDEMVTFVVTLQKDESVASFLTVFFDVFTFQVPSSAAIFRKYHLIPSDGTFFCQPCGFENHRTIHKCP